MKPHFQKVFKMAVFIVFLFLLHVAPSVSANSSATATIIYYDYPPEIDSSSFDPPHNITTGPDGNLWFTGWGNYLGHITLDGQVTAVYLGGLLNSVNIIPGPGGALWLSETHGSCGGDWCFGWGYIGRYSLDGSFNEWSTPMGRDTNGLTIGSDGNIWFPNADCIVQVPPTGDMQIFDLPAGIGVLSLRITTGPDGNLWFPVWDSTLNRSST